jgi:hypothetical protein
LETVKNDKIAEQCESSGLYIFVCVVKPAVFSVPSFRQVLKDAIKLQLWDVASSVVESVAPHYAQLRSEGCLDGTDPAVEEALRRAYAVCKQAQQVGADSDGEV